MLNRRLVLTGFSVTALAACTGGAPANSRARIDRNVNAAVADMYNRLPFTRDLANRSRGILIMPGVIKAGLIVGASYGEGALRLANDRFANTADYYSFGAGSVGWQAGAQKIGHALFFLSDESLANFRRRSGFEVGADLEVTVLDTGVKADVNTTEIQQPIVAVVFSQTGLLAGASLEGAKYTKIKP